MNNLAPEHPILVSDLKPAGYSHPWFKRVALAAALLTAVSSPAAQLIWDAGDTSNGATFAGADAAAGTYQ
jgi:hypothetical protein